MLKFIRRFWIVVLLLITACSPVAPITSTPAPTAVVDDLAQYKPALITADQNDLAQLDHPTRYNLTLQYDPATPTLTGVEDVRFFNHQSAPLNEIYFRLFANYPDSGGKISVSHLSVDGAAASATLETQNTALRVGLSQPLAPRAEADLHLDFVVTVPRDSTGHYADFTATDSVTTMPTVYPLIPAYDSQGWHTELPPAYGDLVYADASLYAVTMTVPTTMTVIASGTTTRKDDNNNGTTTWHIVGAPMRDFDLNVSAQLQKTSATLGETTVNSWYDPADADAGKSALQFATDALRIFQNNFGTYPYRKFDVVETPTTAGGIEYPTLVVVARSLYRDPRNRQYFEFATAHEVSHQWWYGMVGDDQVNQPWVDEALAQYSALIYEEDLYGKDAAHQVMRNNFIGLYNRAKNAGQDMPVNLPVAAYDEATYGAIVYGKGPLFYDAIRTKMGDALFFKFLQTYFQRYRYKIATSDDILKTAEDVCNCSLQNEYQEWILSPQK